MNLHGSARSLLNRLAPSRCPPSPQRPPRPLSRLSLFDPPRLALVLSFPLSSSLSLSRSLSPACLLSFFRSLSRNSERGSRSR